MFKDTATYAGIAGMKLNQFTDLLNTDANEAFIKVLQGAKGSGEGFAELAKNLQGLGLDGARSTAVLGVLANNIDKLREKQAYSNKEFAKGTSIVDEFNTKNTSAQANLEKAKKRFSEIQRELGERLTPAYTSVISKSSLLIKSLGVTVEFLYKYGRQLSVVVGAIAAYTLATKIATMWQARANRQTLLQIISQKSQTLATNTQIAATQLWAAAQMFLTGNIKGATQAMRVFNSVTKMNPLGFLASLLTIVASGFLIFRDNSKEAASGQKELNDEVRRGNELFRQTKTLKERVSIVKNLSKEQLGALKVDLEEQIKQEEDYHAILLQNLKTQLSEDEKLK